MKVPIGFARRAEVRLLARELRGVGPGGTDFGERARMPLNPAELGIAVGIWMEFAEVGMDWRPLRVPFSADRHSHPWKEEEVTYLIESAAGWVGTPGMLVEAALNAGMLRIEIRGDVAGLMLHGFAELNEHLLPGYVSMQKRGGLAAGEAKRRKIDAMAAQQQRRMLESKSGGEELPLVTRGEATAPEAEAGIQLIMQIDRACGRETRLTSEYDDGLIAMAVAITRAFTQEQIEAALTTLSAGRDDPSIIKRADFVLDHFGEYLSSTTNVPHGTS